MLTSPLWTMLWLLEDYACGIIWYWTFT